MGHLTNFVTSAVAHSIPYSHDILFMITVSQYPREFLTILTGPEPYQSHGH
jgi:hypothetical protein